MNKLIKIYIFTSSILLVSCFVSHIFIAQNPTFPWFNFIGFLTLFVASLVNRLFAISLLIFMVPFTANISEPIKIFFNLDISPLNHLSLDISIGLILGLLIVDFLSKDWKLFPGNIPPKKLVMIFLMLSFQGLILVTVAIAISRNLYQAASPYSVKGFFYNLTNIRYLGWHDDYFPLSDLFVFTTAITLSIRLLTLIQSKDQLRWRILIPLFAATVIILIYALWSKLAGIGNQVVGVEGVNSFLPDIHAFGGYALAAFLGGLYYLTSSQIEVKLTAAAFSLLATVSVVVSGSRFSIATLFITFLIYVLIITKNSKKYLPLLTFITLIVVTAAILLNYIGDRGLVHDLTQLPKTQSFEEVNVALSYRPELFRSSLLMYSHYPILGIGKGIFFRQSSFGEFSHSTYFVSENGSNAHNYFLQILTETGLVGLTLFCMLFIYQAIYLRNRHTEIVSVLILGIFLGNVYGHSLLISNILIILFILLGVSTVELQDDFIRVNSSGLKIKRNFCYFILAALTTLFIGGIIELKTSYGKVPFQQRFVCYQSVRYIDKHTSGLFEGKYKARGKNFKLKYTVYHPDVQKNPLIIDFKLEQGGKKIASKERTVNTPGQYEEKFDISKLSTGSKILLQFKTSRCLTPLNLGLSLDKRRLGIQLNKVYQDKKTFPNQ